MDKSTLDFSQLQLVTVVDVDTSASVEVFEIDTVGVAHKMMHNLEYKKVKMTILVLLSNNNQEEIGRSKYDFIFHVPNLENFYTNEDNKVIFNGIFVSTLIGISYSTLRGILLQLWQKSGFILPIIEPNKILANKIP